MRSGFLGFIFGAVLTLLFIGLIYWMGCPLAVHSPKAPPAAESWMIPRCDGLIPTGSAEAWGAQGFRLNVLQGLSDTPSPADIIPARAFLAWTGQSLLVRVEVDVAHTEEAVSDNELASGDCVELFFSAGANLSRPVRVSVAPGVGSLDPKHPAKRETVGEAPEGSPTPFPVTTLSSTTAKGYAIEFSLPFSAFGVSPEAGQTCAMQILVHHRDAGGLHQVAWSPSAEIKPHSRPKITVVLGKDGSSPIDSLAHIITVTPALGQVVYSVDSEREQGHVLSVQHQGKILYLQKVHGSAAALTAPFSFPENWNQEEPILVCDNQRILATLSKDQLTSQIKALAKGFAYRFTPSVFVGEKFPHGGFEQEAVAQRLLGPISIETTFYDAQYHPVTEADKPGRYGAVVRIHCGAGVDLEKFITLYRQPGKIPPFTTDFSLTSQFPPDVGIDPAVLQKQKDQISAAFRGVLRGDLTRSSEAAVLLAGLAETPADAPPAVHRTGAQIRNTNWWYGLRQQIGEAETYKYLTDLPAGYEDDPSKHWPLIIYLHGSGESGDDLIHVRGNGLAKAMGKGLQIPAIVVSPQCPAAEEGFLNPVLLQLLDEVCAKYRVDQDRVYLTGLSMGGYGSFSMAEEHPERFAAIVPLSGGGDPLDAAQLKNIPVWAFHGEVDAAVPLKRSIEMVEAIRKIGGHAHLTIYPHVGHGAECWDVAYHTDALYTWLFAQKRGQPEVPTPGMQAP